MIHNLSQKLTSTFIYHRIIDAEDREVYIYSFELLLSAVVNLAVVVLLICLTGQGWRGFCFGLSGAPAVRGRVSRVLTFFLYPELYSHFHGVSGSDHFSAAALLPAGYSGSLSHRHPGHCAHSAGGP